MRLTRSCEGGRHQRSRLRRGRENIAPVGALRTQAKSPAEGRRILPPIQWGTYRRNRPTHDASGDIASAVNR